MLDNLIDEIIEREGRKDTNNPNDSGGRTKYGISERSHPGAWANGPPTLEEAKRIYFQEYIVNQGFHKIKPEWLMEQVVDFGVHSGPHTSIVNLQRVLGVQADGKLGPITLGVLEKRDPEAVNTLLVKERVKVLARIVQKRPKDLEFLWGWLNRALSFLRT